MEVNTALRAIREEAGLSIRALALRVGIDHSYMLRVERGTVEPGISRAYRIARVLARPIEEVFPPEQYHFSGAAEVSARRE